MDFLHCVIGQELHLSDSRCMVTNGFPSPYHHPGQANHKWMNEQGIRGWEVELVVCHLQRHG